MSRAAKKRWVNVLLFIIAILATGLAWSGVSLRLLLSGLSR